MKGYMSTILNAIMACLYTRCSHLTFRIMRDPAQKIENFLEHSKDDTFEVI